MLGSAKPKMLHMKKTVGILTQFYSITSFLIYPGHCFTDSSHGKEGKLLQPQLLENAQFLKRLESVFSNKVYPE